MAEAKVNGDVATKPKGRPGRPKAAVTKAATAKAAKVTKVAAPTRKGTKRVAEEEEEEEEERKPQPKKAKVAAPAKSAAAAKPIAKTKALGRPKKTAIKEPSPKPAPEDEDVEMKDASPSPAPAPKPAPAAPKKAEKIFALHDGVAAHSKVPVHKIGVQINDAPTQRLAVFVFGEGSSGELGLTNRKTDGKEPIDVKRPRLNPYLDVEKVGVVQVAVGGMHCAALTHDNRIITWGVNDQGALGRDTEWEGGDRDMDDDDSDAGELNPIESTPTAVDSKWFPEGAKFTQLVASDSATFAVTEDGAVYGWGTFRNNEGILGFSMEVLVQWKPVLIPELKKITTMAAGTNHILALNNKGKAFAWGSGQQNQLGRRVVQRTSLQGLVPREFGLRGTIVKIACGSYHSFAIDAKGQVWSWGLNSFGETGVGFSEDEAVVAKPVLVESLGGYDVVDISGGSHHSIACTKTGDVLVWGRCDGGQCGVELTKVPTDSVFLDEREKPKTILVPTKIDDISGAVMVNAGSDNCFATTKEGTAYSWGFNANYQTGQGGDEDVLIAAPIQNQAVKDQKIVAAYSGGQFGVLVGVPKA